MSSLTSNLRLLSARVASLIIRSDIHSTSVLMRKRKLAPRSKHDLPEPIKTSWGKMVSRGMIPREPPTKYTIKQLEVLKTGGRGVDGRIEIRRIGGGKPVMWRMTDLVRITADEPDPKIELIRDIVEEQTRSAYLALVASGDNKRWIIATDGMQVGDIIKSTRELPTIPIQAQPGDCHPVGALPIGSQVCCIERYPFDGSKVANAAGTSATIVKKVKDQVYLKMPSKREMIVDEKCLCVFGRASNTERNKKNLGKAGAARWLGIRPKSGLWLRKTGLAGRKIKPTRPPKEYNEESSNERETLTFTVDEHLLRKRKPLHYEI